jgi:hypothetical protein
MAETEQEPQQPTESEKSKELSPEMVARLGDLLNTFLSPLYKLRETTDKAHTGFLAYMDRVVLLAGGTLTLTFTALATISSHLYETGRTAIHPQLIVSECWLLVMTIACGLLYSRVLIILRQKNDQTIIFAEMGLSAKIKLLSTLPGVDASKVPDLTDNTIAKDVKRLETLAKACALIVHLSLTVAFICLAFFIQANIGVILTVATHGKK